MLDLFIIAVPAILIRFMLLKRPVRWRTALVLIIPYLVLWIAIWQVAFGEPASGTVGAGCALAAFVLTLKPRPNSDEEELGIPYRW